MRRDLERYGGTVEKFIGDAVVAVFGAPTAHEDDPERAVRAALAARESIAALNDRGDALDLHVRVGVATGEALVTLDARAAEGESMVAGDVMNTAARIQAAAPVDGILVGAATHRATERAIVYREREHVSAKGKTDPVEVWEAVEAMGRVSGPGDDDPSSPLVGRENERALLLGAFARVRVERSPQLVTLVGVPGIGKSRLVIELREAAAEDEEIITWRYGRCLPYGDGVTFWALGEIVKAQAGIRENDTAALAAEKLGRAVADVVPEADRRWVEPSLRPLVGLVSEDVALADRRTELQAGWRVFLEALAEQRPLVVVIDDLQWADDGLLDFVDGLLDLVEGVPLLVVCCARPELLERRPGWGGGKRNALTVSLAPLTEADVARLVESYLGRDPADADLRANVVELAAGNPLYAEELVRMRTSGGDLAGLPDTVLGIVTARVDLLPHAEKELLRDAAVMGGVVWSDGLQVVSTREPEEVDDLLRSLGRKEFLRRERQSAVAGATQHSFVHSLVRDAVYAQLPRPDRIDRHVRVALVGGSVRDAFLGARLHDLDFTTTATPDEILAIVAPIADTHWDIGRAFGTIGARFGAHTVEITTYRADVYDGQTRKPVVEFGSTLEGDLIRRDFTVNALALRLPQRVLVDPSGGVDDLLAGRLTTPGSPEILVRGRPAADAARREVHLAAGLHRRRRHAAGHGGVRGQAGHRVGRAHQRRAEQTAAHGCAACRARAAGRHRPGRPGVAGAAGAAPADRRTPPSQGRVRAQPHRAGPGDRVGAGASSRLAAGPDAAAGRAVARHRQTARRNGSSPVAW